MVELEMSESADSPFLATPWAGPMVALGACAFKFVSQPNNISSNEQLFIAITVPIRNFAASLIAAGWMLKAFVPETRPIDEVINSIRLHAMVCLITKDYVIVDKFRGSDERRIHVGASSFRIDAVRALAVVENSDRETDMPFFNSPTFGPFVGNADLWSHYLAKPPEGLTIVGSKTSLVDDFKVRVNTVNQNPNSTCLRQVILPKTDNTRIWATKLMSPKDLPEYPEEPLACRAAILDGASAIKSADLIESPLIIAVIDRNVMDDTASESVIQKRNSGSEKLNLNKDLGWQPSPGVEAIAFRTRR
jgi:hypothetical protein